MPYTCRAVLVIGLKVRKFDLFKAGSKRGCTHELPVDKSAKFCSTCGASLWDTLRVCIDPAIKDMDDFSDTFFGLSMYSINYEDENRFIGDVFELDYDQQYARLSQDIFTEKYYNALKKSLKENFEKHGLWREEMFGHWLLKYESY